MKKVTMAIAAALMLQACEQTEMGDVAGDSRNSRQQTVTFRINGAEWSTDGDGLTDADSPQATRGAMTADGSEMTHLWIFDYVGDELVQMNTYTPDADDWGCPSLTLGIGTHRLYFVASRGDTPTVDESATTITWATPKDTFWKSLTLTVAGGGATQQSVTLNRVATKMRLQVTDRVPDGIATLSITPATWYFALDYTTGEATDSRATTRTISVPASYAGTSGQLAASVFCVSPSTAWQTDIAISAKDGDGHTIGSASVSGAPFERNRVTGLSGSLFASVSATGITIDDGWQDEYTATW